MAGRQEAARSLAIEARATGLDLVQPAANRGERIAPGTRLVAGQVREGWAE
ncbi:MAG: hypothetical protein ACLQU5_11735 [Isosphaeraceae bacterium]